jgi:hypothetical protein
LKEIGLGHILLLLPLLVVGVMGMLQFILTTKNISIAALLLFSIASLHFTRKDRFFLEQLPVPIFFFYLLDYSLISSPVWACLVFWAKWSNLALLFAGILLLAFIKSPYGSHSTQKGGNWFQLNWIPIELFEWRSGLRKNISLLLPLYFIGLIFSYYPIVIPIVIFIIAFNIPSFFQFYENKDLLLAVNRNKRLLQIKAWGSLKLFNVLMLPLYILFIFFHHHGYQYIGALFVVSILSQMIIVFAICMKYKNYRFNHFKVHNSLPLAIFIGCMFIPFLWPIPILMLIQFWKKAQENLLHHYA